MSDPSFFKQLVGQNVEVGFPMGQILPGPGIGDQNAPWSWHFNESDLKLVRDVDPECNLPPSEVEENLTYFLEVIGKYCPKAEILVTTEFP